MNTLNRRAFLATAAVGLRTTPGTSLLQASQQIHGSKIPQSPRVAFANALNFSSFVQNKEKLALSAVMAMRPIACKVGSYPSGSLFLFPFSQRNSQVRSAAAFLPGSEAGRPLIASALMATLGLPADEFSRH